MAILPKFLWQNFVQLGPAGLSCDSQESANPVRSLRDQIRGRVWRSKIGWTIVTGWNDKIDYNNGSVRVATLAAGTYGTGAALSSALQAALTASYGTGTWTVTYSTSTFKFTIVHSATAFTLLWGSGANVATNCALDLGWAKSNTGSSTTQTSTNATYQSRHYVSLNIGSALPVSNAVILQHNAGTLGTFTLQGAATAVGALTAPSTTQVLAGAADVRIVAFTEATFRYWVLIIDNTANVDGYAELGIWYVGGALTPTRPVQHGFGKGRAEFSEVSFSDYGVNFQDQKGSARTRAIEFKALTTNEIVLFETMFTFVKTGRNFFFVLDPTGDPTGALYGFFPSAPEIANLATTLWNVSMSIQESI